MHVLNGLHYGLWASDVHALVWSIQSPYQSVFQKKKPLTSANVKFSVDWPSLPFLPLCGH